MTQKLPTEILDLSSEELRKQFSANGIEPYRAEQITQWIYQKGVYDFDLMTNLSLDLRKKLKEKFTIGLPRILKRQKSKEDRSIKLLLELEDGHKIETVYMPMPDRKTVCVSTQAGCKYHCVFCASGQKGFFRHLSAGEMTAQVLMARDLAPDRKITHVVFMGVGEPLDNYDALLKTVRILNSKHSVGIGARKMTISTCGIIPKIEKLVREDLQIELSVSLHGATDHVRGVLMPVNKAYPVKELAATCRKYADTTKRAVTYEYVMIEGLNASAGDAADLAKLLKGTLCKVNLIPYNEIEEFPHHAPSYAAIVRFQDILEAKGIRTTVRFSKGQDIAAACGQLRAEALKDSVK